MVTRAGLVKKVAISAFEHIRKRIIAITLRENDELIGVKNPTRDKIILLIPRDGHSV